MKQVDEMSKQGERWNQRFNEDVLKWISVKDKTPKHEPGKWSDPVIAMSDIGLIFQLSYCGGWQRTGDFMSTGSSKVTHWIPMPKFAEDDKTTKNQPAPVFPTGVGVFPDYRIS